MTMAWIVFEKHKKRITAADHVKTLLCSIRGFRGETNASSCSETFSSSSSREHVAGKTHTRFCIFASGPWDPTRVTVPIARFHRDKIEEINYYYCQARTVLTRKIKKSRCVCRAFAVKRVPQTKRVYWDVPELLPSTFTERRNSRSSSVIRRVIIVLIFCF